MHDDLFVFALAMVLGSALAWGFCVLPREQWQILASIPIARDQGGGWRGLNLTWYGVLIAIANVCGAALALVLLGALGIPVGLTGCILATGLAASVPAAKWLARVVEKKRSTFTVAGASWVGFSLGPWIAWAYLRAWPGQPPNSGRLAIPAMACLCAGYAVGEGLGRLACISFGCCYGRPLDSLSARWQGLCNRIAFVFEGPTKKASYEGGLEGRKVLPIQAVTAVINVTIGLAATALILHQRFAMGYLVAVVGSQSWRFVSELFRADYRGGGRFSAYQYMAVFSSVYAVVIAMTFRAEAPPPQLTLGLWTLWDPGVLLSLQMLALIIVWFMGRSTVTASHLSFYVVRDRI